MKQEISRQDIILAFEQIEADLNTLCRHILDELDLPLWVTNGDSFEANKDRAIYILKNFLPAGGLSPQATFSSPGVIAGNVKTLDLVKNVNIAKNIFLAAIKSFKKEFKGDAAKCVRNTLSAAGYPGLKLKQITRHLKAINYHPRRVSWAKSKTGSYTVLTRAQAEDQLKGLGESEHIKIQLAKLSLISPDEPLVKYREIKPTWLANITAFKQGKSASYQDIRSSIPIFYLHDKSLPPPIVCFSETIAQPTTYRADKKIEDNPFLSSIHVYRYKSK